MFLRKFTLFFAPYWHHLEINKMDKMEIQTESIKLYIAIIPAILKMSVLLDIGQVFPK